MCGVQKGKSLCWEYMPQNSIQKCHSHQSVMPHRWFWDPFSGVAGSVKVCLWRGLHSSKASLPTRPVCLSAPRICTLCIKCNPAFWVLSRIISILPLCVCPCSANLTSTIFSYPFHFLILLLFSSSSFHLFTPLSSACFLQSTLPMSFPPSNPLSLPFELTTILSLTLS